MRIFKKVIFVVSILLIIGVVSFGFFSKDIKCLYSTEEVDYLACLKTNHNFNRNERVEINAFTEQYEYTIEYSYMEEKINKEDAYYDFDKRNYVFTDSFYKKMENFNIEYINMEALEARIKDKFRYRVREQKIYLSDFMEEKNIKEEEPIASFTIKDTSILLNFTYEIETFNEFSFLDFLDLDVFALWEKESIDDLSDNLFRVLTDNTSFYIKEHKHKESYITEDILGYNLLISKDPYIDLVLYNDESVSYYLDFKIINKDILVSLYAKVPYTVEVEKESKGIERSISRVYNGEVTPGEEIVTVEGSDGMVVNLTKKLIKTDGELYKSFSYLSEYYFPNNKIIEYNN